MSEILVLMAYFAQMYFLSMYHFPPLLAYQGVPYSDTKIYYLLLSGLWFFPTAVLLKYFSGSMIMTSRQMITLVKGKRSTFMVRKLLIISIKLLTLLMFFGIINILCDHGMMKMRLMMICFLFDFTLILVLMLWELYTQRVMYLPFSVILLVLELLSPYLPLDPLQYYMPARGQTTIMIILPIIFVIISLYLIIRKKDFV